MASSIIIGRWYSYIRVLHNEIDCFYGLRGKLGSFFVVNTKIEVMAFTTAVYTLDFCTIWLGNEPYFSLRRSNDFIFPHDMHGQSRRRDLFKTQRREKSQVYAR